ncbi:death domain-containing protein CRADD isoform X2 [Lampris incognitus]|uniref:death domain-containing protein CRADD isoform X2 n=1 Tax=Lampris incognitus TaxID=2546036 RepID=UPI0024B5F45E|nr:death domain-containing protein CRADD isoform X2 [Lampris incognitus]
MDAAHRDLLRRRRLDLASQVLASDTVVQVLYQEGVLTESQFEDIESQATNRKKMLRLLDILPARGPRAFGAFLRSLEEFSWVRAALLRELESGAAAAPHGPQDDCHMPEGILQRVPSDRELSHLASRLGLEWESVLLDLGLSTEALVRCRANHMYNTHGQILAGLVHWRRSQGRSATIRRLLQSLQAADIHPSILEGVLQ